MPLDQVVWVPIVGTIAGCAMIAIIIAIVFWHKTRVKELEAHREMRLREMEHERGMKELEIQKARIDLDRARMTQPASPTPH